MFSLGIFAPIDHSKATQIYRYLVLCLNAFERVPSLTDKEVLMKAFLIATLFFAFSSSAQYTGASGSGSGNGTSTDYLNFNADDMLSGTWSDNANQQMSGVKKRTKIKQSRKIDDPTTKENESKKDNWVAPIP